ncbi:hypothetical protein [Calderihabitans maritimus]|uniref:Uncharacterized protein n=1 Tax=Calderihabitans maritimus TaxID=1246530 RepID=A0A1Z5HT96_9FIRM|nr:hypothetical protein [Calderihabitans maritimus]GAW92577.1 hypothetical protein KKC1_17290 [Calderihabitans maritimus]
MKDIIEILEEFIPEDNPRKWAKLASNVNYRRLHLLLLKEILLELRKMNQTNF